MAVMSEKMPRCLLAGSGFESIDKAATGLLRSLQDINDNSESDGEETPARWRPIRREASSPAGAAFPSSSPQACGRARIRAGGQARAMPHSTSLPSLSRNADSAVCRGRGERMRNVGQSMLQQDMGGHRAQRSSPEPFGGNALSSSQSSFKSLRSTMNGFDSSQDDWAPQQRDQTPQHRAPRRNRDRHLHFAMDEVDEVDTSKERKAVDDLQALRREHAKTVEQLEQTSRKLTQAQAELERWEDVESDSHRQQEEIDKLRSALSKVRADRDQYKAELQLARQQSHASADLDEELAELKEELSRAKAEKEKHKSELEHMREELKKAQGLLPSKEERLQQLQGELRNAQSELLEKAKAVEDAKRNYVAPLLKLEEDITALKKTVQEKTLENKKIEREQEKVVSDYSTFINHIINSSARPILQDALDMNSLDLLGAGNYGYVMTCRSRSTNDKVVIKLQGIRWMGVAVREWAHSAEVGRHPNVVESRELFIHSDSDGSIQERLVAGFNSGTLTGKRPKWLPNAYLCMVTEFMDSGSVCSLMDQRLLTLEGVCAVTRQVASALAFMHQQKRTHNDIKPENILLKRAPDGNVLVAKLADVGLVEHSVTRSRDYDLFAYTIWCMVVGRHFSACPAKESRQEAMADFQKASLLGRRATARGTALIEVVDGLWNENMDVPQIAIRPDFQNCEVREPEAVEMRRHLAACAISEVRKRADESLDRFQRVGQKAKPLPIANLDLSGIQMGAVLQKQAYRNNNNHAELSEVFNNSNDGATEVFDSTDD